jgi:hypothetical protein
MTRRSISPRRERAEDCESEVELLVLDDRGEDLVASMDLGPNVRVTRVPGGLAVLVRLLGERVLH